MNVCSVEGCGRPRRKRGWCETHYSRFRAHGTPNAPGRKSAGTSCVWPGCKLTPVAQGQCTKHYYWNGRMRRRVLGGTAVAVGPATSPATGSQRPYGISAPSRRRCDLVGCTAPAASRGWCGAHYQRWRRFGDPEFTPPEAKKRCSVPGCDGVTNARGYCGSHYYRWQTYGDPLGGQPIRRTPMPTEIAAKSCATCGDEFTPRSHVQMYCGRKCRPSQLRGGSVNRRAWVERLGKRDGWNCHLCGQPVDPSEYWPNSRAGSVDHIVPVSLGGDDAGTNLALAHLGCNTGRKNSPLHG